MPSALFPGLETQVCRFRTRRGVNGGGEGCKSAFDYPPPFAFPVFKSALAFQLQDQRCCLEVCPQRHPLCDLIN